MRLIDADAFIKWLMDHSITERECEESKQVTAWINAFIDNSEKPNNWIPYSEQSPEDRQKCLVTAKALNRFYIDIVNFTTDLYSVDKYDFYDKKGKSGWYFFDSDLGYVELPNVIAWMPSPKPYRKEKE